MHTRGAYLSQFFPHAYEGRIQPQSFPAHTHRAYKGHISHDARARSPSHPRPCPHPQAEKRFLRAGLLQPLARGRVKASGEQGQGARAGWKVSREGRWGDQDEHGWQQEGQGSTRADSRQNAPPDLLRSIVGHPGLTDDQVRVWEGYLLTTHQPGTLDTAMSTFTLYHKLKRFSRQAQCVTR